MAVRDAFHYGNACTELSQGMQRVLQASDWHEGIGEARAATVLQCVQQERGNLQLAQAHLRSALMAVITRLEDLTVMAGMTEKELMAHYAPEMEKLEAMGQLPLPGVRE